MGKELYQLTKLLMFKNHIFSYFQSIQILDKDQLLSQSSHILLVCFSSVCLHVGFYIPT